MFNNLPQYPLTGSLKSPMQISQGRSARSDLSMSNVARKQLGIQPEVLRNIGKNEKSPTHDLHVGKHVMYQVSVRKWWHPAVITSLCQGKHSYTIATSDGVVYRKMQAYLKPYTPQGKNAQAIQSVLQPMAQSHHMQPVTQLIVQSDHMKSVPVNNPTQVTPSRPETNAKLPVKLDL